MARRRSGGRGGRPPGRSRPRSGAGPAPAARGSMGSPPRPAGPLVRGLAGLEA